MLPGWTLKMSGILPDWFGEKAQDKPVFSQGQDAA
jgi:hypothetical protein